jgi:hypothetical protein
MAAPEACANARWPHPNSGLVEKRRIWRDPRMLTIGRPDRYPVSVPLSESGLNFALPAV